MIIKCGLGYFIMKKFMALSVQICSTLSVKIYLVFWVKQSTTCVEEEATNLYNTNTLVN